MLDQEAIAVLAHFCCPSDSPDEDWFRAEAALRNRLAAAAAYSLPYGIAGQS